jgi:hypothetical protein
MCGSSIAKVKQMLKVLLAHMSFIVCLNPSSYALSDYFCYGSGLSLGIKCVSNDKGMEALSVSLHLAVTWGSTSSSFQSFLTSTEVAL